ESIAAFRQQVLPQAVDPVEFRTVHHFGMCVDWMFAEVVVTVPPNGIESFQREPEGIDSLMTMVTLGISVVLLGKLAHGKVFGGFFFRQLWHVFGWFRELVTEQCFGHPIASQDGAAP